MVKKETWFSSVKKALSPNTNKEKKAKKANNSKKDRSGKEKPSVSETPNRETVEVSHPQPLSPLEDVKLAEPEVENEQTKHAYDVAVASAEAAEAAVAAAEAEEEVMRLTMLPHFAGKSSEEIAAIRIQTAFRGHLARRALRALRGLVRLKSLVDGSTVKRQTSNTLKCMQTLSRVQSQIQSRRLMMLEENRALQRQLIQKSAKELESLRMGEGWDDSLQSKEKIEADLLRKYDAAMRREKSLAYSYTHQQTWKKSTKPTNLLFMDPANPHWGWSWLERWMAARSWETQTTPDNKDTNLIKGSGGEITKSFARHQLNSENNNNSYNPSSPSGQKPPPSPFTPSKSASSMVSKKIKSGSPRGSTISQDADSRSTFSVQSELGINKKNNRRHTIGGVGGSSVSDDASCASVPSYMAPTKSAKARLRLSSPLGMEGGNSTPDTGSVTKRLSFAASPARHTRRHSGPPKVEPVYFGDENGAKEDC